VNQSAADEYREAMLWGSNMNEEKLWVAQHYVTKLEAEIERVKKERNHAIDVLVNFVHAERGAK